MRVARLLAVLLDGSMPTTIELMLRSIEWAAKAR
jgi:hypothetical protein